MRTERAGTAAGTAARRLFWWAVLAAAAVWVATLAGRGLYNPDEGRYAEIPREMLAGRDFVIPHLDGLVYIEKPPLQYWATAAAEWLFGCNGFGARLYCGLAGLATVLVTAAFMRRLFGPAAAVRAAVMLGSSLLFILLGHQLTLDMSLTLYMTATFAAFCLGQDPRATPRTRTGFMLLAWAAAAAAFLTKGLIACVLPAAALVIYSAVQRDFGPWRRLALLPGLALFALLSAPWFVLIQHRLPQFFEFFFVREHFQRFLTRIEQRYQPWWFFIPVLLAGSLPWTVPAVRALATGWRAARPPGVFDARRFAWIWCAVVFGFFSASDSKLIPYILPMFPPLALLMATGDGARLDRDLKATARGLMAAGLGLLLGALLLARLLHDPARAPVFLGLRVPLAAMGVAALAGGGWALGVRDAAVRPLAVAATGYACFCAALWAAVVLAPAYSGASLYAQLPPDLRGVPAYSVGTYDQSLTFYLGHPVTLVQYRGELDFGLSLQPAKGIDTVAAFEQRWRDGPQALAVLEPAVYRRLQQAGVPMVVRARDLHRLIVSRQ
ncbi:MAG TPA: phospholipid carrier-dependent glycosyltransferase [Steroidobacteraceae bacterium]|nr:phospholipid carrier-dependent glycosyltransferase [Steroidobacteraceae bacterium]